MYHLDIRSMYVGGLVGWFFRGIVRDTYNRYMNWRINRDYNLSVERTKGCEHKRTIKIDVGPGPDEHGNKRLTDKCLDCWAINSKFIEDQWYPNSANPKYSTPVN